MLPTVFLVSPGFEHPQLAASVSLLCMKLQLFTPARPRLMTHLDYAPHETQPVHPLSDTFHRTRSVTFRDIILIRMVPDGFVSVSC